MNDAKKEKALKGNINKKIVELEKRIADHSAQIIMNGIEIQNIRFHTIIDDALMKSQIKSIESRIDTALYVGVAALIITIAIGFLVVAI